MRRNGVFLMLVITVMLLSGLFAACTTSPSVSGETGAELEAAREKIDNLEDELSDSRAKVSSLQQQIMEMGAESGLVGNTPEETAINIIRYYHETHTYSKKDLFVCADMAKDVWNMLQAQGIDAVIQIGDVEKVVLNMEESSHAWVKAEISPGEYLALETTNGQPVLKTENPLYYAGWSFDNPQEYKRFEELKYEYNVRAGILNSMIVQAEETYREYQKAFNDYQDIVEEFNSKYAGQIMSEEAQALYDEMNSRVAVVKELEGRYNQLQILMTVQQKELDSIVPKMKSLAQ